MQSRGFTLLELMVALAIFSLIGIAGYAMLHSVTNASGIIEVEAKKLRNVERSLWIIHEDVSQMANRPILDESGAKHPPLEYNSSSHVVEFTKAGWRNPFGFKRSELQRVRYELKDKQLWRYYWTDLDRSPDSKPGKQLLFKDITAINFRFLDNNRNWQDDWQNPTLPAGLEVNVKTANFGDLREVMEVTRP